jgi:hypothetical protein
VIRPLGTADAAASADAMNDIERGKEQGRFWSDFRM